MTIGFCILMLGKQYETAGMHNQALEAFGKIDRDAASAAELASVYSFYTFIYESLASQSLDKSVTEQYNQMAECYKDSILLTAPDSRKILSEKKKDCGDYRSALDIILPLFEELSTEDASMGPVALEIADIYSRMGLEEQARHYLIISAMSDIVNGMINRFYADIISDDPQLVVITAGTNDFAQNDSWGSNWDQCNYVSREELLANIALMATVAEDLCGEVIIGSICPSRDMWWKGDECKAMYNGDWNSNKIVAAKANNRKMIPMV